MIATARGVETRIGKARNESAASRLLATCDVAMLRLNWGCGPNTAPGWLNIDRLARPGVHSAGDIRDGLQLRNDSIDYAVAMHVIQDLPYLDVGPALVELRRALKPGGVLRLGVPDLERAIDAWRRGDARYFYIPDDEVSSLGGKLIVQATWYGSVRTPFTWDFLSELTLKARFTQVRRCEFRQTHTAWPDIVALDNRQRESLYVEAVK